MNILRRLVESGRGNQIRDYQLKVERILGHSLPNGTVIHHRDGNPTNNTNSNLIVCEDQAYHKFIEMREKAYRATGDANKRKCHVCKEYDNVDNMYRKISMRASGSGALKVCCSSYQKI